MYQLTNGETIIRLKDNACIPADPRNSDYAAYLEWIKEGNTPEPVPVPTTEELAAISKATAKKIQEDTLKAGCPTSLRFRVDCMDNNVADFDKTLGLISISPAMTEIIVRDYDNVNHTITVAQYKQMCVEIGVHVMTIRQAYWTAIDNE